MAAALVFGVGLLIVGFSLPPEQHDRAISMRWYGAAVLIAGMLFLALATFESPARKSLAIAVAATIYGGIFVYHAASNELSGTATYHRNFFQKGDRGEKVTRDTSPVKFRTATSTLWGGAAACLCITCVSFLSYRSLRD